MPKKGRVQSDGNEAAASVAFRASEAIVIYPITPGTPGSTMAGRELTR